MTELEKFVKLLEEPEKLPEILVPSIEETQKNLQNLGINLTIEELNDIKRGVIDANTEGGELSVEMLEGVSGGASNNDCYKAGKSAGKVLAGIFKVGLGFVTSLW